MVGQDAISSIPAMTLVASSSNRISRMVTAGDNTLWFEEGMGVGAGEFTRQHEGSQIQHWQEGASLLIDVTQNISAGAVFTVDLTNASWYFRQSATGGALTGNFIWNTGVSVSVIVPGADAQFTVIVPDGEFDPAAFVPVPFPTALPAGEINLRDFTAITDDNAVFATNLLSEIDTIAPAAMPVPKAEGYVHRRVEANAGQTALAARISDAFDGWDADVIWSWAINEADDLVLTATQVAAEVGNIVVPALLFISVVEMGDGYPAVNGPGLNFDVLSPHPHPHTFNHIPGVRWLEWDSTTQVLSFFNLEGDAHYRMDIAGGTWQTRANITLLNGVTGAAPGTPVRIEIPLVVRTTYVGNIRVNVNAGFPQITNTAHMIAEHVEYRVNVTFADVTMRPYQIDIGRLILTEQRPGAILGHQSWAFELRAPSGYEWETSNMTNIVVGSPLAWADGIAEQRTLDTAGIGFGFIRLNNEEDRSRLIISVPNGTIQPSTTGHGGQMIFLDLRLIPISPNDITDGRILYADVRSFINSVIPAGNIFIGVVRNNFTVNIQNAPAWTAPAGQTESEIHISGSTVTLTAGNREGYSFSHWSASPTVAFANANIANTSFAMPGYDVIITANWTPIPEDFMVSIQNTPAWTAPVGQTASGEHTEGDIVTLAAGSRANYTFNGWTVVSPADLSITNASSQTNASFVMPSVPVTVRANWMPISAPQQLAAPAVNISGTTLNWTTVANAVEYRIYVNGAATEVVTGTSFNLAGFANGTTLQVRALGTGNFIDSVLSNTVVFTATAPPTSGSGLGSGGGTTAATQNPSQPRDFIVTPGNGNATLEWAAPSSTGGRTITRYEVSNDGGRTWRSVGSDLSYIFTNLTNGNGYDFRVRAVTSAGAGAQARASATPSDSAAITPPVAPPVTPPPVADGFSFVDVSESAWYYESVRTAWENSLFAGTAYDLFSPQLHMTRAMFAQVLANLSGANLAAYANDEPSFRDVAHGTWYFAAIEWAVEHGVVLGVGVDLFAPHAPVTREQMAAILYRYAEIMDIELPQGEVVAFTDQQLISYWAMDAVIAIQNAGLITGRPDTSFDPFATASRAEVATIFARFLPIL